MNVVDCSTITKVCSQCEENKSINMFSKAKGYKDGYRGQCNQCRSDNSRIYVQNNPEKYKAFCTRKNRDRSWEKSQSGKESRRKTKLIAKYNIDENQYNDMLDRQKGVCAICKTDVPGGRWNKFHVDHCHKTGFVRGLLCAKCNTALGLIGDTYELASRYIEYLSQSMSVNSLKE